METFVHGGVEYQLPSQDGLIFQSRSANYTLAVRSAKPLYDHGVLIGEEKALDADFGDSGSDVLYDEEGNPHYSIRGHFCHTLIQGEKKGWSAEERTLVEKKLLVSQNPGDHWLHTTPPAQKPWPTYDETHHFKIPKLAADLGLVTEALVYEKQNKKRAGVVKELEAHQSGEAVEAEEEFSTIEAA